MIDTERRRKLAYHLRQLAIGQISNDEFETNIAEDVSFGWLPEQYYRAKEAKCDDAAIQPMLEFCWNLYSDLENHKLEGEYELPREFLERIAKYILFLHSENEYEWDNISFVNPIVRFSCKEILLSIITLGKYYREKRQEQEDSFNLIDKGGKLEYYPFVSRVQYEKALKKSLYLSISEIEKKWTMPIHNWGLIFNQFLLIFSERFEKICIDKSQACSSTLTQSLG